MKYAVVIHKDEESSYGVTVPDLPGCFSGGDTLDEAFSNVVEAITGHIDTLLMDDQPIPATQPLEIHQLNSDFQGGLCWGFVDVDLRNVRDKAVRINITMPSRILEAVDGAAARSSQTRSGFLMRAALDYINRVSTP